MKCELVKTMQQRMKNNMTERKETGTVHSCPTTLKHSKMFQCTNMSFCTVTVKHSVMSENPGKEFATLRTIYLNTTTYDAMQ